MKKILFVLFLIFYSSNAIAMTIEELKAESAKYNKSDNEGVTFNNAVYTANEDDLSLSAANTNGDFADAQDYLINNPTIKCVSINGWAYMKQPDGSIGEEIDKPSYECEKLR